MAFDPKVFASELGLSDEDKTALFGLFEKNPAVAGKLESVFTREVDARLSPLQTQLETKQRDLDAQFETLASIRGNDGEAIAAAEKRIEKLASERAILENRFRSVATQNGLDADALLKDITTEAAHVVPEVKPLAFDPAKLLADANRSALSAFENAALMEDLASEHMQLFGKPMSRVELIGALKDTVKRTGNVNLGLRDVFETKFNVQAKRDELREVDVQKRIDAAVATAKTAQADEFALRGSSATPTSFNHAPSPIFGSVAKDDKGNPIAAVHVQSDVPEGVRAAMADFQRRVAARKAS
jgi:hypothetical protein